jgi:endonuclease/exonuclease/phosphatase family metal-dependent hydrolase
VGTDGVADPERIANVLRRIDADVVALQEVAYAADQSRNLLRRLAEAADAEAIAGPTLLRATGHYGNALLTRLTPTTVERLDISIPGREPRGAIMATLEVGGRPLHVITTHLGLLPGERRRQFRRLLTFVAARAAPPTILLGDFNEWLSWSRPLRQVRRYFGRVSAPATFPSWRPVMALDRLWIRPAQLLTGLCVYRTPAARTASDHLPLVAEVKPIAKRCSDDHRPVRHPVQPR